MKRKTLPQFILSILTVLLVCVFPPIFLYSSNAGEAAFSEVLSALLIFCGVGIVMFVLCWIVMRFVLSVPMKQALTKATLITSLFMLVVLNYSLIEKAVCMLLPNAKYWHIVPILLVVWLHVGYFIYRFMTDDLNSLVSNIICLVMGVLIVMNICMSLPQSIERIKTERTLAQQQLTSKAPHQVESVFPNFYVLLFDEYANFPQIKKYYGYDNDELLEYLKDNYFSVSLTSENESYMTATVTTNMVNLDYIVDDNMSEIDRELVRKSGRLFSLLQENGYQLREITTTNYYGLANPLDFIDSSNEAVTMAGDNLETLCIKQTIAYPFYQKNWSKRFSEYMEIFDYVSSPEVVTIQPTFTMMHIEMPHTPFIVDANGNMLNSDQYYDWENRQIYLGQYQFASQQIKRILENLLTSDPGAIIVLMSDHGARGMLELPDESKKNPLNAVYFLGKEDFQIEGLSTVNTFRTILNELFQYDFEMIPLPEND